MREVVETLKRQADVIILDTAPAELLADAALVARCADAAVIEVTTGFQQGRCAHLGCGAALEFLEKLQKIDALKSGATLATTHVNHLSGATQEEFEAFFSARGISAGYDGMELVF